MKGGYQILDLTGLDLEVKSEQTSISDPKILKQLDGLKSYIEDGYNYSKPLNNQLKPILLRFRDKKNGEKQEASVWANLSKKTDNLTFVIETVVNSTNLSTIQIEIVFELKQDEANDYYGIKTAKYLLSGGVSGGTKLYLHNILIKNANMSIGGDTYTRFACKIVSTSETAFTNFSFSNLGKSWLVADIRLGTAEYNMQSHCPVGFGSVGQIVFCSLSAIGTVSESQIVKVSPSAGEVTFTDTVTEL